MPKLSSAYEPSSSTTTLTAPPHIHALLTRLHTLSLTQEKALESIDFTSSPACYEATSYQIDSVFNTLMSDKFVALEQDKCLFVYNLIRASRAKTVLEIGTSYGVSTIYLALGVTQNYPDRKSVV